jgi:hypothetical protein
VQASANGGTACPSPLPTETRTCGDSITSCKST